MHKLQSIKRESIHKRSLLFLRWNWKLEPLHCFYGREHKQGISIANSIPHLMAQQILYYEQQTNAGYKIEYNHNLKVEKSLATINQIPKLKKKPSNKQAYKLHLLPRKKEHRKDHPHVITSWPSTTHTISNLYSNILLNWSASPQKMYDSPLRPFIKLWLIFPIVWKSKMYRRLLVIWLVYHFYKVLLLWPFQYIKSSPWSEEHSVNLIWNLKHEQNTWIG